jgi:hypothetical protein
MGILTAPRTSLRDFEVQAIYHDHPGYRLEMMPDNKTRAAYCARKAAGLRSRYWDGQQEAINDVLRSTSPRYGYRKTRRGYVSSYPQYALQEIGKMRWSSSAEARSCASDEQMWTRFADHYTLLAQLDRVV